VDKIWISNFISAGSIEHRILYLLEFKRSVFAGVIEEEGKDEVMLEGFLESVKAMTEVDLELPGDNAGKNIVAGDPDNLAAEANARYLQGDRNNDEQMQETGGYREQESNFQKEQKEKQKQGILGFLGKKVRRFLKRVFRL